MKISLGDLFTLKSHPFLPLDESDTISSTDENNQASLPSKVDAKDNVLIAADANFIPPIFVACEMLSDTGVETQNDKSIKIKQVRGIFYSHRTHKYERHWFKVDELKRIDNKHFSKYFLSADEGNVSQDIKSNYVGKIVILRNVEVESEKEKISQERKNFENLSLKRNPYLNFVPPVMTVIDVRVSESSKISHDKISGRQKRSLSPLELKCRYYNSISSTFSEEWLPIDCLADISNNFDVGDAINTKDRYFLCKLKDEVHFEESDMMQTHSVVRIKELVFNHYLYVLKGEDIWTRKVMEMDAIDSTLYNVGIDLESEMSKRIPNREIHYPLSGEQFEFKCLYEIEYLSDRGIATKRLIYITDKYPIPYQEKENGDTLLVANCILRNGKIRHFKARNIKSARKLEDSLANQLISEKEKADD